MRKITELTVERTRTVETKDATGARVRTKKKFIQKREVTNVPSGLRFGHFIIDGIAFQVVVYVVRYLFDIVVGKIDNWNTAVTILLIQGIVLLLLYPALYCFCEYKWQRTPGKFLTRTLVIDQYGNKPDLRTFALRSLLRLVPFEAFSCLGGDNGSRGWHDRWSDTWVVKDDELAEIRRLQAEQAEPEVKME